MIGVIGLSHKSAPVEVRERFTMNEQDIVQLINSLKEKKKHSNFVLLSTCNRTEIYFYLSRNCISNSYNSIIREFIKLWKVDDSIKKFFYTYHNQDAVAHLFKVASGLDAMILGEDQILGQVKDAFQISAERDFTGPVLNKLFHKAFEIGKKVRTKTAINEGATSISYAAVELITSHFSEIRGRQVFLIGAGQTGELAVKSLQKKGADTIVIANRDFGKAEKLAETYLGRPVLFSSIEENLIKSDIVITSTGSKDPLITEAMVKKVMAVRKNPLYLIDISVPRNIEEAIKNIKNVFLFDIDDLENVIKNNYLKRESEIVIANKFVEDFTDEFFIWMDTLNLTPTMKALKEKFEGINASELAGIKNKLSEAEYNKVVDYGNFISGKFANMIIGNMITTTQNGRKLEYLKFINELFELN